MVKRFDPWLYGAGRGSEIVNVTSLPYRFPQICLLAAQWIIVSSCCADAVADGVLYLHA